MATVAETASVSPTLPTAGLPPRASDAALPGEILAEIAADEFFAMADAGVFDRDRRMFLWDGRICEKMAKTPSHSWISYFIAESIRPRLPGGWLIWVENPVQLDPRHVPLPDVTVIRGPADLYLEPIRHPAAGDVGMIVEIAVTSLPRDLGARAGVFAQAGVPVYWVADVWGRRIIRHREPMVVDGVGRYADVRTYGADEEIEIVFDGRECGRIPLSEWYR